MKIAYITDTVFPTKAANGIQSLRMCEALSDLGHEVNFYCNGNSSTLTAEHLFSFYGVKKKFAINFISQPLGRFKYCKFAIKIFRLIKKTNVSVIYTRHLCSAFCFALQGEKVIYEIHKCPSIDGLISRFIFQRLLKFKTFLRLVVVSEALKKDVCSYFEINEEQIIIAHDGAKVEDQKALAFVPRKSQLNVGYLGSPFLGKGIEAIIILANRTPDYCFHVIGCSLEDIRKQITFSLTANVFFYGFVDPSEAANYLQKMDVLIAPFAQRVLDVSGRDIAKWMSPLKIFEYMAAKKPIIASNLEVIREVLKDGENALLCEPENWEQWADALDGLAKDNKLKTRLAENAYRDFLAFYTWERRAKLVLSGYS